MSKMVSERSDPTENRNLSFTLWLSLVFALHMDAVANDLRRKFEGCSPRINHITVVEPRCIRVDYSNSAKIRWLEIWAMESNKYSLLCHDKVRSPVKTSIGNIVDIMKGKFTLPEKV